MSQNIYLVDVGLSEPTTIYELVPKKVAEVTGYPINGIIQMLHGFGARHLVVDAPDDRIIDELILNGFSVASGLPNSSIASEAKRE